jgi:hypothetical protein
MASTQVGVGSHDDAGGSEAQKVIILSNIFHDFLSLLSYTNLSGDAISTPSAANGSSI